MMDDPICGKCGWEQSHTRHHDENLYNYHPFAEPTQYGDLMHERIQGGQTHDYDVGGWRGEIERLERSREACIQEGHRIQDEQRIKISSLQGTVALRETALEMMKEILLSLNLYIGHYEWKQLTTPEKNFYADMIDADRAKDRPADDPYEPMERWWQ